MEDRRNKLQGLVRDLLEQQGVKRDTGDDEPLISSGILDSLAVIQIVVFMEQEFGIDFSTVYFDQNDFDSVDRMWRFAEQYSPTAS